MKHSPRVSQDSRAGSFPAAMRSGERAELVDTLLDRNGESLTGFRPDAALSLTTTPIARVTNPPR